AGKAFDFRADLLLAIGGALAVFAHFILPTVMRVPLRRKTHDALFAVGVALVLYGIVLTVVPGLWTPFGAKFTMPKVGWAGVFAVAIGCDLAVAGLSLFGLSRVRRQDVGSVVAIT